MQQHRHIELYILAEMWDCQMWFG